MFIFIEYIGNGRLMPLPKMLSSHFSVPSFTIAILLFLTISGYVFREALSFHLFIIYFLLQYLSMSSYFIANINQYNAMYFISIYEQNIDYNKYVFHFKFIFRTSSIRDIFSI